MRSEVKRTFNPEFLNRVDEVIIFNSLTDHDLLRVVLLMVEQLNAQLAQRQISLQVTGRSGEVGRRENLLGPQLWRPPAAPGAAEVHRGPPVGSADPGQHSASGPAASLSSGRQPLLPPGGLRHRPRRTDPVGAGFALQVGSAGAPALPPSGPLAFAHAAHVFSGTVAETEGRLPGSLGRKVDRARKSGSCMKRR